MFQKSPLHKVIQHRIRLEFLFKGEVHITRNSLIDDTFFLKQLLYPNVPKIYELVSTM